MRSAAELAPVAELQQVDSSHLGKVAIYSDNELLIVTYQSQATLDRSLSAFERNRTTTRDLLRSPLRGVVLHRELATCSRSITAEPSHEF